MNFKYIVWHTAAHGYKGTAFDTTAKQINEWHIARGWNGIGYQRVIRFDGSVEAGRSYDKAGAHVAGLNSRAIGYCFSGHGDLAPLTTGQLATGLRITKEDMAKYGIPVENVIGHNEVNAIVKRDGLTGVPAVNKSCPGKFVDMGNIRNILKGEVVVASDFPLVYYTDITPDPMLKTHTLALQRLLQEAGLYLGSLDGWAGLNTSEAFKKYTGYYLKGDPRI